MAVQLRGYLLVAVRAGAPDGTSAATFYLVAYFVTTLGAFGVVTLLSASGREMDELEAYRGLFWRRPFLAGSFTAMLFSLAGLPLTAGFPGKVYLVTAGAGASLWALVITLVLTSAIGIFYYSRVVVTMYDVEARAAAGAFAVVLTLLVALPVWSGLYPRRCSDGRKPPPRH